MKIKRNNSIRKVKVSDLEIMRAYLILDKDDDEQILFVNHDKGHCFSILNYSNDEGLCCLHHASDSVVRVIGKIDDMDICNLKLGEACIRLQR